jgi:hypothetical protein
MTWKKLFREKNKNVVLYYRHHGRLMDRVADMGHIEEMIGAVKEINAALQKPVYWCYLKRRGFDYTLSGSDDHILFIEVHPVPGRTHWVSIRSIIEIREQKDIPGAAVITGNFIIETDAFSPLIFNEIESSRRVVTIQLEQ